MLRQQFDQTGKKLRLDNQQRRELAKRGKAMKLAQREVEIVHIGCQVNGAVMAQVARNMTDSIDGILNDARFFVCDHDPLYTKEFRQLLTDSGVEVIGAFGIAARSSFGCLISASLRQTRVGCPQQNGYAESFVSAIKRECIDQFDFLEVIGKPGS